MISIVWRGAGILVPILFFISGWITSYWYEDITLGNTEFMKWTLLWPGILLTLIGLFVLPFEKDPETGKLKYVGNHDLFWVPMVVWGVLFLFFSVKFFMADPVVEDETEYEETYGTEDTEEEAETEPEVKEYLTNYKEIAKGERVVKIYNPTDEPITIYVYPPGKGDDALSGEVPSKDNLYIALKEGDHVVQYENTKKEFSIDASTTIDNYNRDDVWVILDDKTDLLLIDATATCEKSITKSVLREIDWSEKIFKRYSNKLAIEMDVKQTNGLYFDIREPYYSLPLSHTKEEQVYTIIPIPADVEATDEFIEDFLISICWKTEGVVVH